MLPRTFRKLTIDINEDVPDILASKQGDALSRYLDIQLKDGAFLIDLSECVVRFYALKPDGKKIFNDAEITDATRGRFQVELKDQTLACAGMLKAELSIFSKDAKQILSTKVFGIYVTERIRDDNALVSSNEYGTLVILFQNMHELQQELIAWRTDMDEEFSRKMDELDQTTLTLINEWETTRRDLQNSFLSYKQEIDERITTIGNDLSKLQTFNFDNLAALDRVEQLDSYEGNIKTETIRITSSQKKLAERITTYNDNGSKLEVTRVYAENGITIIKESNIVTTYNNDGTIKKTVNGFNDYSISPAFSNRISGGHF